MQSLVVARPIRNALVLAAILAASIPLYGCYTPAERALGGGMIGGLAGAGIGALASGGLAGPTLAASAIGAAGGATIGALTAPRPIVYVSRYVSRRRYYY